MNILVVMTKFSYRCIPHGEKFGIVLMLVNPAWQEKFCDESYIFVSRIAREVWVALMLS